MKSACSIFLILAILLVGIAWMILMSTINSSTTALNVQVSGVVDEVLLYRTTDANHPVADIHTGGRDVQQVINLTNTAGRSYLRTLPPAQYYFTAVKGPNTYRGGIICCATSLLQQHRSLIINDLGRWEQSTQ